MIFEKVEREDEEPKEHNESSYSFLNRSSWSSCEKIREFLNLTTKGYPESETNEIVSRIKCGNDRHFDSAVFELILYQVFISLGCELTPHPVLPNGQKSRPDFLVETPKGEKFYLEAVLASAKTNVNDRAEKLKGTVYNSIDKISHHNFFVEVDDTGNPNTPPKGRALKKSLKKWLDSLDPDQVIKDVDSFGFEHRPQFDWEHDGWYVIFRAIPIKPERRGKGQRTIGMYGSNGGFHDSWSPIRDAIIEKGRKYGVLDKPLVIAVNSSACILERIDEMQALFGQERFSFTGASEPSFSRAPNGAWHSKGGPRYTRISAAWIFKHLMPWSVSTSTHTLYCNPYSTLEIPDFLFQFPHGKVANGKMVLNEGAALTSVLGLHEEWPN